MIYKIIVESSPDELESLVSDYIELGYRPIGGVAVTRWEVENERKGYKESSWEYCQAVIKEED